MGMVVLYLILLQLSVRVLSLECFGVDSGSGSVCSGNGDCIAQNDCYCDQYYTGPKCSMSWEPTSNRREWVFASTRAYFNFDNNCCSGCNTDLELYWTEGNDLGYEPSTEMMSLDNIGDTLRDWQGVLTYENENYYCIEEACPGCLFTIDECLGCEGYDCESVSTSGFPTDELEHTYVTGNIIMNDDECYHFYICGSSDSWMNVHCTFQRTLTDDSPIHYCDGYKYDDSARVCNARGTCSSENTCIDCDFPYDGSNCDECMTNYFDYESDCTVTTCNGIFNNDTGNGVCGNRGDCYEYNQCNCYPEVRNPEDPYCDCPENYFGSTCETTTCNGYWSNETSTDVCNNRGDCLDYNECTCFTEVLNPVLPYCTCPDHYFGPTCEITTCQGFWNNDTSAYAENRRCSGHGECYTYNDCTCVNEHYSGRDCNNYTCNGIDHNDEEEVCTGHGSCDGHNNCTCEEDYFNANCSYYECYGEAYDDEDNVCSGHGECVFPNNCSCSPLYPGEQCELWSCFDIPATSTDEEVCAGNGLCIDWDRCFCYPGYSSLEVNGECTEYYCGTYHYTNPLVCTERGTCIASQTCACDGGFEGDFCETWSCGGVDYKFTDVTCSGNGKCETPSTCTCNSGFDGENCDKNLLYGYVMAPILSIFGTIMLVLTLVVICCVVCLFMCCVALIILGMITLSGLGTLTLFGQKRMQKFGKLRNIDILLKEQEIEENENVAHLKINKKLFEISYKEIQLKDVIGEGGSSSVVYKAVWKKRTVAFKCFRTRQVCQDQNMFSEFESEIKILSSCLHPSIIRFFGGCLEPPRVGIVMEFCENGDLVHFLRTYTKWNSRLYPLGEKIRMIHEISSAMEFLHGKQILHRDLKLENVLVDSNENCKLMDFGLSKIVERMSKVRNQTRRIGTNIYMSPEICTSGIYDNKTDVFSFSIMCFIMITQNYYPYGRDERSIEVRVSQDPNFRPNLDEVDGILLPMKDEWLKKLIEDCWHHEPEKRKSFHEIIETIEKNSSTKKTAKEGEEGDGDDETPRISFRADTRTKRKGFSVKMASPFSKKGGSGRLSGRIQNRDDDDEDIDDENYVTKKEYELEKKKLGAEKKKFNVLSRQLVMMEKEKERLDKLYEENAKLLMKDDDEEEDELEEEDLEEEEIGEDDDD